MTRFNLILIGIIAILILSLVTCNSCKNAQIAKLENQPKIEVNPVEVVRVDSIPVHDTIRLEKPVPIAYIPKGYVKASDIPAPVDHQEEPAEIHDSTYLAWLYRVKDDYFAKVAYRRTIPTRYGNIILPDTAHQNRLLAGQAILDFTIPQTTITRYVQEKRRVRGYLTGSVEGSFYEPVRQVGAGFMLQFKNFNAVEVQAKFDRSFALDWKRQPFEISYKQLISLK